MNTKQWRRKFGLFIISGVVIGVLSACSVGGQSAPEAAAVAPTEAVVEEAAAPTEAAVEESATGQIPEVEITKVDGQLTVPDEVPSGPVVFVNNTGVSVDPVKLNEGVTADQLMQTLAEDEEAALQLVSLMGGPMSPDMGPTVYDLQPGNYLMVESDDEGAPTSLAPFTTGDPSGATPPTADVEVQLVDFAFAIPGEIKSGPQTWAITNNGTQWHEMAIGKLAEGVTIDDLMTMIMSEEEPDPSQPEPFELVAGWSPMGPGLTAWTTIDLPPGEYTILCFLPDLNGDFMPHASHGMIGSITVTP
ncbi:MAG: hypothetical protein R3C44_24015 [Chloroflexota bacterium]